MEQETNYQMNKNFLSASDNLIGYVGVYRIVIFTIDQLQSTIG